MMKSLDILCASDLTQASNTALHYALDLAERAGTRVTLLHVLGRDERAGDARELVNERMERQVMDAGGDGKVRSGTGKAGHDRNSSGRGWPRRLQRPLPGLSRGENPALLLVFLDRSARLG